MCKSMFTPRVGQSDNSDRATLGCIFMLVEPQIQEKAFDHVPGNYVREVLWEYGVSSTLLRAVTTVARAWSAFLEG